MAGQSGGGGGKRDLTSALCALRNARGFALCRAGTSCFALCRAGTSCKLSCLVRMSKIVTILTVKSGISETRFIYDPGVWIARKQQKDERGHQGGPVTPQHTARPDCSVTSWVSTSVLRKRCSAHSTKVWSSPNRAAVSQRRLP